MYLDFPVLPSVCHFSYYFGSITQFILFIDEIFAWLFDRAVKDAVGWGSTARSDLFLRALGCSREVGGKKIHERSRDKCGQETVGHFFLFWNLVSYIPLIPPFRLQVQAWLACSILLAQVRVVKFALVVGTCNLNACARVAWAFFRASAGTRPEACMEVAMLNYPRR